jgi:uncharacterized SAM-binding protein YcdF (DUF218 family)
MARIDPRSARSRGFVEPPRRLGAFMQLVLFVWFLLRFAVASAMTAAFVGLVVLLWFGFTMPSAPEEPEAKTDAIIVLTGPGGRLEPAYALLQKGLANRMFVTGVYRKLSKPDVLKLLGDPPPELAAKIELGYRALDTRGNAGETAAWFNSQNLKSMRLVTSSYHMRRSVLLFRRALPDARIVVHPVPRRGLEASDWWSHIDGVKDLSRELAKFLATMFYIPIGT